MKKLISALTALTLAVVSSVPMLTSAIAVAPNRKGTLNEVILEDFGEQAIVEYSPQNMFYFVMSPKRFGNVSVFESEIAVKLKKNSEFDEKGLNQLVWKNCTPYVRCEKSDDNTYVFSRNRETYSGPSSRMEEEIYPDLVSFLSECEDVASINKYQNIAVGFSTLINFKIAVNDDVDFDYEKYSDYNIEDYKEYGRLYLSLPGVKGETFYENMYYSYISLKEEYGEENVYMTCDVLESGVIPQEQSVEENLYTALITGDTNADGGIDIADALAIASYVGNPSENQLNESSLTNADVNGDGFVDTIDILVIQQYLAGIITEL